MIDARVAGVPSPQSFIAARSTSSVDLLAGRLHRGEQRRVGVARGGGVVSLRIAS